MLTKQEVEHIADLARIGITEEETEKYQKDLSAILEYFKKLDEIDTSSVEPIGHIAGVMDRYREDVSEDCSETQRRAIIASAPDVKNDSIKVKSVF